jgi:hypothetical protein
MIEGDITVCNIVVTMYAEKHKQRTGMKQSITPEERTKSDRYRVDNQGGDGVQVRVTGVHNNQQPGDLEAREGTHVTVLPP